MKGITDHQLETLKIIFDVATETSQLIDLDQLLEKLSWEATKASSQFVIRALIEKNLIEKSGLQRRRGRNRVCFKVTHDGEVILDPRKAVSKPFMTAAEAAGLYEAEESKPFFEADESFSLEAEEVFEE